MSNKDTKKGKKSVVKNISPNYSEWDTDTKRLVLYADFMGFKERVIMSTHHDLKKKMKEFRETWEKQMKPLLLNENLKFVQFSDSILIVANGTTSKMFSNR